MKNKTISNPLDLTITIWPNRIMLIKLSKSSALSKPTGQLRVKAWWREMKKQRGRKVDGSVLISGFLGWNYHMWRVSRGQGWELERNYISMFFSSPILFWCQGKSSAFPIMAILVIYLFIFFFLRECVC